LSWQILKVDLFKNNLVRMMPNNKLIVVAAIFLFTVLGTYLAYNAFLSNPEVDFHVMSFIHEYESDDGNVYYAFEYTIGVQDITHHMTLYNCKLEVEYLTSSGEWEKVVKDLGTQNFSSLVEIESLILPDFKINPDKPHSGNLWQTEHQNIRIKAYGYEKP